MRLAWHDSDQMGTVEVDMQIMRVYIVMGFVAHLLHQGSDNGGFQALGDSQVQGRSGSG